MADFPMPYVDVTEGNVRSHMDIFSRLLKDRIIFIWTPITAPVVSVTIAAILYLANEKKGRDINLYINSPGGSVAGMFGIIDTMRFVPCDVATYCVGQAASAAAIILSSGTKGKRYCLPNSRVMIHQPNVRGEISHTALDLKIEAEELLALRAKGNAILAETTGQPIEVVERDTDRDFYMSADEAKEYGIVDEVLNKAKDE